MAKRKTEPKRRRKPEVNLWGEPFEDHRQSGPRVEFLDFEGHDVRVESVDGIEYWYGPDVCRACDIANPSSAYSRLDDDEKLTLVITEGQGGARSVVLLNEAGLFSLILTSTKPEAKRFKRWLTHLVLPALRKNGTFSLTGDRTRRIAKRNRCDSITAAHRAENIDVNKQSHGRLKDNKATPNHFKGWHNGRYVGLYGLQAKGLRRELEIKGRRSPLDFMATLAVIQNSHATALAERMIQEQSVPLDEQAEFIERISRDIAEADSAKMGNLVMGIRDDPRRGKVLDYVPRAMAAQD